jgi:hypothetical protein
MNIKFITICVLLFAIMLSFASCDKAETTSQTESNEIESTDDVESDSEDDKTESETVDTDSNQNETSGTNENESDNKLDESEESSPILNITAELIEEITNDDGTTSKKYMVTANLVYESSGELYTDTDFDIGFLTGGKPRHEGTLTDGTASFEFLMTPDLVSESISAVITDSPWGELEAETGLE